MTTTKPLCPWSRRAVGQRLKLTRAVRLRLPEDGGGEEG